MSITDPLLPPLTAAVALVLDQTSTGSPSLHYLSHLFTLFASICNFIDPVTLFWPTSCVSLLIPTLHLRVFCTSTDIITLFCPLSLSLLHFLLSSIFFLLVNLKNPFIVISSSHQLFLSDEINSLSVNT